MAADLQPQRVGLVAANAGQLGASDVLPVVADGTAPPFAPASFDHVLVDAPCSGLGTLRRRPDARWRIQPTDVVELAALQQRIIDACGTARAARAARSCTACARCSRAESIDHAVPDGLRGDRPSAPVGQWRPFGDGWRVLPHDAGTDGMILLRYRRTA